MRRPWAVLILVVSSLIAVPAIAGPYEDATKAYGRGDYKTATRDRFQDDACPGRRGAEVGAGVETEEGTVSPIGRPSV